MEIEGCVLRSSQGGEGLLKGVALVLLCRVLLLSPLLSLIFPSTFPYHCSPTAHIFSLAGLLLRHCDAVANFASPRTSLPFSLSCRRAHTAGALIPTRCFASPVARTFTVVCRGDWSERPSYAARKAQFFMAYDSIYRRRLQYIRFIRATPGAFTAHCTPSRDRC